MTHDDEAIISLEAWRLKTRKPGELRCAHARAFIDERAGTVTCRDCDATLSAFWVLGQVAREENRCAARVKALKDEAEALTAWVPFLRAMRVLEKLWRGRKALPVCPHCRHGLWPDELVKSRVGIEIETARRRKGGVTVPPGAVAADPP